ncbi:MAG: histidine phosphatase family protein [Pseudomonadota bacterium]|nr:histidine phosphatase family protein [Pseudomonadota bacterium]
MTDRTPQGMDLILWRHAEAQEPTGAMTDMDRPLTPRGDKQAERMAAWLKRHLPPHTRILCSPAIRTEQTVLALGRQYKLHDALAPGASPQALLQAAGWPQAGAPVLIVGHQPTLGATVAQLLGIGAGECAVKKGAVWWLRQRVRHGQPQTVLVAVQQADKL